MPGPEKMFLSSQQFVALLLTKCQAGVQLITLSNNKAMKYLEYLIEVTTKIGMQGVGSLSHN